MEKAIKIINESLNASLSIAEDYNKKARFELSEGDTKKADSYKEQADRFLKRANECELALEELKSAIA